MVNPNLSNLVFILESLDLSPSKTTIALVICERFTLSNSIYSSAPREHGIYFNLFEYSESNDFKKCLPTTSSQKISIFLISFFGLLTLPDNSKITSSIFGLLWFCTLLPTRFKYTNLTSLVL